MNQEERATELCWLRLKPSQKAALKKEGEAVNRKLANYLQWIVTKHLEK